MRGATGTSTPVTFVATALRRHLALLIVLTLAGAACGVGVAMRQGPRYTASSSIMLNPLPGNPYSPEGRGDQLVNVETEAQLVRAEGVTKLVRQRLGLDVSDDALRQRVSVENPPNSQILHISYTASTREEALRGAQAFATAYLSYRENLAKTTIETRLERLRSQQPTSESLQNEIDALRATDLTPGHILSPADAPESPRRTDLFVLGGAGGIGGLLIGVLLALVRTRRDDRLHDANDVEAVDLRLLGVVPDADRYSAARAANPAQGLPECYRAIRTAVITSLERPPMILSVAGVSEEVSAAPEATAIAVGLARSGFTVVLVDAVGEATRMLAGRSLPGLAEVLAGEAELRGVLVQPEDNLVLLPFGQPQQETMDQLLSPRMLTTIRRLRDWYDYVIIAGQSAAGADGQTLAALTDGVVLIAIRGVTTHRELSACTSALARVHAVPVGAVVLDRPSRRRGRTTSKAADESTAADDNTPQGDRSAATTSRSTVPSADARPSTSPRSTTSSTTSPTMTSTATTHTTREAATRATQARSGSTSPASAGHDHAASRTAPASTPSDSSTAASSALTTPVSSSQREAIRGEAPENGHPASDHPRSPAPDHEDDYPTALLYPADER